MKSLVLFVVASLMLVVATIAVAVPNPVQAEPTHSWVWIDEGGVPHFFQNKGDCNKSAPDGVKCEKTLSEPG